MTHKTWYFVMGNDDDYAAVYRGGLKYKDEVMVADFDGENAYEEAWEKAKSLAKDNARKRGGMCFFGYHRTFAGTSAYCVTDL